MRRSLALAAVACSFLFTGCSAGVRSGASAVPTTEARSGIGSVPSVSASANGTPALTVAAWYSGGGRAVIASLNGAVAAVVMDDLHHDDHELGIDCLKLTEVLAPARFYPPIPDAQAQRDWSTALAGLYRGYATCDSGPASNAGRGAVLVEEAAPDLARAVERIDSLPH